MKTTASKYGMRLLVCVLLAATAGSAMAGPDRDGGTGVAKASVRIFADSAAGPIKELNGGNLAPPLMDEEMPGCDIRESFARLNIPITRLHDAPLENAGMRVVDIPLIFANFHADANDPRNYYFDQTDDYIRNCVESGTQVYYRLGTSIEHSRNKYFTDPPSDAGKWIDVVSNVIRHYSSVLGLDMGLFYKRRDYTRIVNGRNPIVAHEYLGDSVEGKDIFVADDIISSGESVIDLARELKKRFPHLKFGGPGHCAFGEEKVKAFAENCAKHGAPLDFYSFHYYSPSDTELLQMALDARRWLDESGFPDTEIHLNEWHYNPYGGALWGMGPVEQNEAIRFMRGLESAAFLNTVLIGWQDTPIDRAFYYTVTTTRWGLYDDRTPNKTYYGMQAFGELTRYGERVAAAGNLPEGSRTLAGRNAAGDLAILTACWKSGPLEIAFDIDGIERFGSVEVRMLDPTHDLEKVFSAGTVSGPLKVRTVSESSVILIELKKSRPDPAEK